MAYDEELAHRIRAALGATVVTEKAMFGGLAFLVGGHMAVAASGGAGGLLVRHDPADAEALLAEPGAEAFEMGGRGGMKGWLHVTEAGCADDAAVQTWVDRGVAYAASLPPKAKKT